MLSVIIICAIVANIFGVALHYVHKPTSRSLLVHIFAAVNESTWEHLKLAFTPMLFLTYLQSFLLSKDYSNIFEANLFAILSTLIFIPVIYYPVRYFLKREVVLISILLFIIAVIFGYCVCYFMLLNSIILIGEQLAILLLFLLLALFGIFTFSPPRIFLFWDPVSKRYGHSLR